MQNSKNNKIKEKLIREWKVRILIDKSIANLGYNKINHNWLNQESLKVPHHIMQIKLKINKEKEFNNLTKNKRLYKIKWFNH